MTLALHAAFGVLLSVAIVPRATADPQDDTFAKLPTATAVIDSKGIEAFRLGGKGGALDFVTVTGAGFAKAARIKTEVKPPNPYGLQITTLSIAPVKKGDTMLAVFSARALEPLPPDGEARTEFIFELRAEPNTKSASYPISVGTGWRKFYVPFEARLDLEAGQAQAIFRAGYDPQTIEIGGFRLLNYGRQVNRNDLPCTPMSYVGREADSPWRTAAAARIEKLRKADLTISIRDAKKNPIPGAQVTLRMKRHAFGFGSAIDARMLLATGPDADRYREIILKNFNKAVIENHLKWNQWEKDRETGLAAVKWLREHGLAVRGHCLVWPGKKNLPQSIVALFEQPDALRKAVLEHVRDEATALRGQLVEWDVLNEPFSNTDLQKILGEEILAEAFRAAREADPGPLLFINDYSILETGGRDFAHQDHYEKTIRTLLERGAPVQGIGIQGHFGADLTPVPRLIEILDRFAKFGLPIQITEFDINTYDEALQADYTRDFMIAMFSHPSISGVLTWGFWEPRHWIPNGAFYRKDWSERPAGAAWRELVFQQWWTKTDGQADQSGNFKARGFLGDYEIETKAGGKTKNVPVRLTKDGVRIEMVLE